MERVNGEEEWDEKVVYSIYIELTFVSSKLVLCLAIIVVFIKMKCLPFFHQISCPLLEIYNISKHTVIYAN